MKLKEFKKVYDIDMDDFAFKISKRYALVCNMCMCLGFAAMISVTYLLHICDAKLSDFIFAFLVITWMIWMLCSVALPRIMDSSYYNCVRLYKKYGNSEILTQDFVLTRGIIRTLSGGKTTKISTFVPYMNSFCSDNVSVTKALFSTIQGFIDGTLELKDSDNTEMGSVRVYYIKVGILKQPFVIYFESLKEE